MYRTSVPAADATMSLPILPMDVIYYLMHFLPWWRRAAPVSKVWVRHVMVKRTLVRHWKSKRLLFSYMTLLGPMTNWSWEFFAETREVDMNDNPARMSAGTTAKNIARHVERVYAAIVSQHP